MPADGGSAKQESSAAAPQRAIVFLAWGEAAIADIGRCLEHSRLPPYPIHLVTDGEAPTDVLRPEVSIHETTFEMTGNRRKNELYRELPDGVDTVLFLDVDTIVLDDVSLGFDKAERHGIAMAPAPHYSMAHFRDFRQIMVAEGIEPRGQLLYNSGVVFFSRRHPDVPKVFELALALAGKYPGTPWGDQPFLTLAMELLEFNPYTLAPSFNHRAFGELVSGSVRVWHSRKSPPANAAELEYGYLHRYRWGRFVRAMKVPR